MTTVYEHTVNLIEKQIAAVKVKRDALPWYAFIKRAGLDAEISYLERNLRGLVIDHELGEVFPQTHHAVLNKEYDPQHHSMFCLAMALPNLS